MYAVYYMDTICSCMKVILCPLVCIERLFVLVGFGGCKQLISIRNVFPISSVLSIFILLMIPIILYLVYFKFITIIW